MGSIFEPYVNSTNRKYLAVRDDPRFHEQKSYLESLWSVFEPYADPDFRTELASQFHPRFWEMYLGCSLLEMGFVLIPKNNSFGPDFQTSINEQKVWIEAAAPDSGTGPDSVPSYNFDVVLPVPEEKIILRLTNIIDKKLQAFKEYRKNNVVSEDDAYVIAINGWDIPHAYTEDEIPYIVKAVLPIGNLTVTIDINKMEAINQYYKFRGDIKKKSGSLVPTRAFQDTSFSVISGIIYSHTDLWNLPAYLGRDFQFVHNPLALHTLEKGWLPRSRSIWVEGDKLRFEEGEGCS